MLKNRLILILYTISFVSYCKGEYSNIEATQINDYIISSLAKAIPTDSIFIVTGDFSKYPCENLMSPKINLFFNTMEYLVLKDLSKTTQNQIKDKTFVAIYHERWLFGETSITRNNRIINTDNIPPYSPSRIYQSEYLLFCLQKQDGFNQSYIYSKFKRHLKDPLYKISADYNSLGYTKFLEKYNLLEISKNKIYQRSSGCTFAINPINKLIQHKIPFHERIKTYNEIITLYPEELSEIVYLHHRINTTTNTNSYNEVVLRASEYLIPVTNIQTKLGFMLQQRLIEKGLLH